MIYLRNRRRDQESKRRTVSTQRKEGKSKERKDSERKKLSSKAKLIAYFQNEEIHNKLISLSDLLGVGSIGEASFFALVKDLQETLKKDGKIFINIRGKGYVYGTEEEIKQVREELFPPKEKKVKVKKEKEMKVKIVKEYKPTNLDKLAEYFESNRGSLINTRDIETNLQITEKSISSLFHDIRKALEEIGRGLRIENIRGKGYVYGTEQEIKKVRQELFPPKEKKERVKKEKKMKVKIVKEYKPTSLDKLAEYFESNRGSLINTRDIETNLQITEKSISSLFHDIRKALEEIGRGLRIENIRGKGYVYGTEQEIKKVRQELFPPKEKKERVKKEKIVKERKLSSKEKISAYFREIENQNRLISLDDLLTVGGVSKVSFSTLVKDLQETLKKDGKILINIHGKGYVYGTEEEIKRVRQELFPPKEKKERIKKEKIVKEKKLSSKVKLITYFQDEENHNKLISLSELLGVGSIGEASFFALVKDLQETLKKDGKILINIRGKGYVYGMEEEIKKVRQELFPPKKNNIVRLKQKEPHTSIKILNSLVDSKDKRILASDILREFSIKQTTLLVYINRINKNLIVKKIFDRKVITKGGYITLLFLNTEQGGSRKISTIQGVGPFPIASEIVTSSPTSGSNIVDRVSNKPKAPYNNIQSEKPKLHFEQVNTSEFQLNELSIQKIISLNSDIGINETLFQINGTQLSREEFLFYCYILNQRGNFISMPGDQYIMLKASINAKLGNNSIYTIQFQDKKFRIPVIDKAKSELLEIGEDIFEIYKEQRIIIINLENGNKKDISQLSEEAFDLLYRIIKSKNRVIGFHSKLRPIIESLRHTLERTNTGYNVRSSTYNRSIRFGTMSELNQLNPYMNQNGDVKELKYNNYYGDFNLKKLNDSHIINYNTGPDKVVSKDLFDYIERLLRNLRDKKKESFEVVIKGHPEYVVNPIQEEITKLGLPFIFGLDKVFTFKPVKK